MLHSPDSTSSIAHALDIADARHWTRQPPKSDWARLRFLQARHTSIAALAAQLNTTPAALQNLLDHPRSPATQPTREAIAHDIIRMWQPRVRRRIHRQIINSQHAPVQVHLCAWFGFDAAAGSSDDGRQRRLTEALPAPIHNCCSRPATRARGNLNYGRSSVRRWQRPTSTCALHTSAAKSGSPTSPMWSSLIEPPAASPGGDRRQGRAASWGWPFSAAGVGSTSG
jgi:hypothetical protein